MKRRNFLTTAVAALITPLVACRKPLAAAGGRLPSRKKDGQPFVCSLRAIVVEIASVTIRHHLLNLSSADAGCYTIGGVGPSYSVTERYTDGRLRTVHVNGHIDLVYWANRVGHYAYPLPQPTGLCSVKWV